MLPVPQLPTVQVTPPQETDTGAVEPLLVRRAWQRVFAAAPVQVRPVGSLDPLRVTDS